ncbi:MAG: phosphotransferase [Chloroflexi bacterium]|nr:phosphotransferase [Chloroflexota bacterium]
MRDGSRFLACKLFDGTQAGERARTESGAYSALAARGAPVPRLLAVDDSNAAVVREWVDGPTLAQALRGEAARPAWEQVSAAWDALLAALDAWTNAMDPARVERARSLRLSEIAAVAESVVASGLVRKEDPAGEAVAEEIRQLVDTIGSAPMRTVPLDLNPGNVVLGSDGIVFVDLEAFGLDFAEWSLCKTTMLPHDPTSGRAGQSLLAGQVDVPRPIADARPLSGALLLALADAAGIWRSEPAHPAGLTLVRELSACTPNVRHLASVLV